MLDRTEFLSLAEVIFEAEGEVRNRVPETAALDPSVVGMPLYEKPIIGFARADDPYFTTLKEPQAIGDHFKTPREWLPEAQTVVSFFFPNSGEVRKSNRQERDWPSLGWVHARAEGMDMIDHFNACMRGALIERGHQAVSPVRMEAFFSREYEADLAYTSNWSERHVAYGCGLGTFGLSKGLITKKGVAGRFTSLITDLYLPADQRDYEGLFDYCSRCGACVKNCPAGAISLETGKDHVKCSRYVNRTIAFYQKEGEPRRRNRRYGCGKCMVKVPCEARPAKRRT